MELAVGVKPSLSQQVKNWMRVFDSTTLCTIYEPKRENISKLEENIILRSLKICALHNTGAHC